MSKLKKDKGFTELVITDEAQFEEFYQFAERLQNELSIIYENKINDFDSLYWIFNYGDSKLVLCYSIDWGISIYPHDGKAASEKDNETIRKLKELISY